MGRLTARTIETTKPRAKPFKLTDGDGLQLRVATDGVKTWLCRYMIGGKERQYRLPEPYGDGPGRIGLKDARGRAAEIRALARLGIDYQQRLEDERAAAEQARSAAQDAQAALERRLTVRKLFERWESTELSRVRKDGGKELSRGFGKDVLPVIGDRYADDIRRTDVMGILDAVTARGANQLANRLLSEIGQMFRFALIREVVTIDPTSLIGKRDAGSKETERERTLSESEIRALPAVIASARLLRSTEHAIWLMLSTGARVGEVCKTRHADIDLSVGTWVIPKENAKNKHEHTVYLSSFAKRHIEALINLSGDATWLMPARRKIGGPACPRGLSAQIGDRQLAHHRRVAHTNRTKNSAHALELAGGNWTCHDLRRTSATLMGTLGVEGSVIERCLNHVEHSRIVRTYQRHDRSAEQREAWRLLGERLDLLTRADADNVTTFQRSA
ncbi:tyrosine-type recombinase/integrase [Paraburkholderia sediminicola]|uniref:tyrosine-type recombinase/integrase n=1 Tax=Paraburkholderia sediminicola TaxID=458836 RepID=UPI0038B8A107